MSYTDIATRYPQLHRRAVLLELHIRESFPSIEAEAVNISRDRLAAQLADLWTDMGASAIDVADERAVAADGVVQRDLGGDIEEETRSHSVTVRGQQIDWQRVTTRSLAVVEHPV